MTTPNRSVNELHCEKMKRLSDVLGNFDAVHSISQSKHDCIEIMISLAECIKNESDRLKRERYYAQMLFIKGIYHLFDSVHNTIH